MKKITIIFSTVLLLLLLTACQEDNDYQPEDQSLIDSINKTSNVTDLSIRTITYGETDNTVVNFDFTVDYVYVDVFETYFSYVSSAYSKMISKSSKDEWIEYEAKSSLNTRYITVKKFVTSMFDSFNKSTPDIDGDYFVIKGQIVNNFYMKVRVNQEGYIDYAYTYYLGNDDIEEIVREFIFNTINQVTIEVPDTIQVTYNDVLIDDLVNEGTTYTKLFDHIYEVTIGIDVITINLSTMNPFYTVIKTGEILKVFSADELYSSLQDNHFEEIILSNEEIATYLNFDTFQKLNVILDDSKDYMEYIGIIGG